MNTGEVIALIKAFGGSGGGGSSGGGALVVNRTWHEDNSVTLDKTWKEISDAGFSVLKDTDIRYHVSHFTTISSIGYAAGEYSVAYGNRYYVATSADGYPSESTGGGDVT